MRGQRGRLGILFAIIGLVLVIGVGGGGTFLYGRAQLEPVSPAHGDAVSVSVNDGETMDQLAQDLQGKQLIKSAFWFSVFARFKGLPDHLRAGHFNLDSGMGASAIIARLEAAPDVPPRALVLAEGLTADQMGDKVAAAKLGISKQQYLDALAHGTYSTPILGIRPAGVTSLEGFLFPDTYTVPDGATAEELVQMQLDDFTRRVGSLQPKLDYNVLTTASILEREAKFADDFPKVASVIDNRLAGGTVLQIDAIVVYGRGKVGQAMSAEDRAADTPYNSYIHPGLPPTPIANPGLATIQAALNPAQTGFLFYVSDGCGHNHYSTTNAEHNQQVQQYVGKPCPS